LGRFHCTLLGPYPALEIEIGSNPYEGLATEMGLDPSDLGRECCSLGLKHSLVGSWHALIQPCEQLALHNHITGLNIEIVEHRSCHWPKNGRRFVADDAAACRDNHVDRQQGR
jgi:hypothetical protein